VSPELQHLDAEIIFGNENPCFGCSPHHPSGLHLKFSKETRDGQQTLISQVTVGDSLAGPPGIVHGGIVMTIADETAAWALIGLRERFGFTASVEGRLMRPVRIGKEIVGRATISSESARIVKVSVTLEQEGVQAFRGELSFMLLEIAAAEKLLGGPLPELWKKLARR
jgi:acyl-coenzyme A thioesterase PaaI-like protein